MGKKAIPDRWLIYTPFGKPVPGTRFLPFKTPLIKSPRLCPNNKFTVECLLENQPNLKAVINLTNTTHYYHPSKFIERGVLYRQIRVPGRRVPYENIVQCFFKTVDEFLEKLQDDPNALIGVHCTHGLNRTGYLICKYMVKQMKINPEQAIRDFEQARGYEIERRNYTDDIRGIEHDPQNTQIIATSDNNGRPNFFINFQPAHGDRIERNNHTKDIRDIEHDQQNKKIKATSSNKKRAFINFQPANGNEIERKNYTDDNRDIEHHQKKKIKTTSNNKKRANSFINFQPARDNQIETRNYTDIRDIKHDQNTQLKATSKNRKKPRSIDFQSATPNSSEIFEQPSNINYNSRKKTPINPRKEVKIHVPENRQNRPSFGYQSKGKSHNRSTWNSNYNSFNWHKLDKRGWKRQRLEFGNNPQNKHCFFEDD